MYVDIRSLRFTCGATPANLPISSTYVQAGIGGSRNRDLSRQFNFKTLTFKSERYCDYLLLLRFVFQVHDKDLKPYSYAAVTLKCIPRIVHHSLFSLGSVHAGLLAITLTLADIAKDWVPIILTTLSLRTQCVRALSSTLCLPDSVTVRVPLLLKNVSG